MLRSGQAAKARSGRSTAAAASPASMVRRVSAAMVCSHDVSPWRMSLSLRAEPITPPVAAAHSSATAGSVSPAGAGASAASRAGSSRPSAHTAAPRTSGDASDKQPLGLRRERRDRRSCRSRSAHCGRSGRGRCASPRSWRTSRGTPRRRAARARRAPARARRRGRRASLRVPACANLFHGTHREAIVAAVDAVAHQRAQFARDRPLCSMVR